MMRAHTKTEILAHNRESLQRLERAIRLSAGAFSVVLVRCDYERLQNYVIEQLQQQFEGLQVLALDPEVPSVVMAIRQHLQTTANPPKALVVTHLWTLPHLNQALKDANLARDQLRSLLDCPLILWLSDRVVRLISRYAQDFKNQAPPTIPFDYPRGELMYTLHQGADQLFQQVLDLGSDRFLPDTVLNLHSGSRLRNELEAALKDLALDDSLNNDLTASLDFLRGRDAHSRTEMAVAKACYLKSLAYWQRQGKREERGSQGTPSSISADNASPLSLDTTVHPPSSLEKAAVLHFYLGLWWRSYAVLQRVTYAASLKQARQSFSACLRVFRRLNQPQRLAQFIHALAEVLQKQQDWPALEAIAQEALNLHRQKQDLVRQARDHGFLAEVALAQHAWETAQKEALRALTLLDDAQQQLQQQPENETLKTAVEIGNRFQRGWYRFLLGEARMHLGVSADGAIALLAEAQAQTNPDDDLTLYRQILDELIHHYFEARQYREAFRVKQERRSVEFRYNLRAFIGAGAVQPHQRTAFARPLDRQTQSAIAAEITASGREKDIENLIQRLRSPQSQLIVIHGPSGVGKSSIVNAGLAPALRRITPEGRNTLPILIQTYVNWQQGIEIALDQALVKQAQPLAQPAKATARPIKALTHTLTDGSPSSTWAQPTLYYTHRSPTSPQAQSSVAPPPAIATLIAKLRALNQKDHFIVLLFDQFEEFFFEKQALEEQRLFYEFLGNCLNRPELSYVKVVLSLREDYLHHLLEVEKVVDQGSSLKDNDILSKDIRYPLGNFSPQDAETVIRKLTEGAQFYLDNALIAVLVQDLAVETGDVRPIELQVVGAQLQREGITTLDQYQALGTMPKQTLVQHFLAYTVADCGPPNEDLARIVLYLLTEEDTDKRLYRPLKTREEIEESLTNLGMGFRDAQLDLVLEILVGSGLVFEVPDEPDDRYQLVHDYLVAYVRQEQTPDILHTLAVAKAEAKAAMEAESQDRLSAAKQALETAKVEADKTLEKAQKQAGRLGVASAAGASVALVLAFIVGGQAFQVRQQVEQLDAQTTTAQTEQDLQQARAAQEAAKVEAAKENLQLRQQDVDAAEAAVAEAEVTLNQAQAAQEQIRQRPDVSEAERQQAEAEVAAAEERLITAQNSLTAASARLAQAQRQLAYAQSQHRLVLQDADLEGAGIAALRQFEFDQLESLRSAVIAGRSLQNSVDEDTPWQDYPAASPLLALQTVTHQIREVNRLLGLVAVDDVSFLRTRQNAVLIDSDAIAFSPSGDKIATSGADGIARLWDLNGVELAQFQGYSGDILQIAFNTTGNQIATSSTDGTVHLWDLNGSELAQLTGHQGNVLQIAYSPKGDRIVTSGEDGTVRLWDLDGTELTRLDEHQGQVWQAAFNPAGDRIVTSGEDGTARLWDLNSDTAIQLEGHQGNVLRVTFSEDGNRVATSGEDGTARLWDLNGSELAQFTGHQGSIWQVTFSPSNDKLATSGEDGTARLWDLNGNELAQFTGHQGSIWQIAFNAAGDKLVTSGADGTARLWNLSGSPLAQFEGHQGNILQVTFSPKGDQVVTSSEDGTAHLWTLSGMELAQFKGHQGNIWQVAFNARGDQVITSGEDGTARLWDLNGAAVAQFEGHQGNVLQVAFSPEGDQIATSSTDGTARLWDLNGTELTQFEGHQGSVWDVAFSPANDMIVTSGLDGTARLWDLNGAELARFEGSWGSILQTAFSPTGEQIVTSGTDGIAHLWDLNGTELAQFEGHQGRILQVTFNPEGDKLATSGTDGTARLWDLGGTELAQLRGHQGRVLQVTFNAAGDRLATSGVDGTARLWDLSGTELAQFEGHQGRVLQVAFSPSGDQLATTGSDDTTRLWTLDGQQIAEYKAHGAAFDDNWRYVATVVDQPGATHQQVELWPIEDLEALLVRACDWLSPYLRTNPHLNQMEDDQPLCPVS